jgi:hypothetical protein
LQSPRTLLRAHAAQDAQHALLYERRQQPQHRALLRRHAAVAVKAISGRPPPHLILCYLLLLVELQLLHLVLSCLLLLLLW